MNWKTDKYKNLKEHILDSIIKSSLVFEEPGIYHKTVTDGIDMLFDHMLNKPTHPDNVSEN